MSRIGKKPISIPSGVTIEIKGKTVTTKGPKGELSTHIPDGVAIEQDQDNMVVTRTGKSKQARANHGLLRSLISNSILGVGEGYTKKLELVGTGYRAKKQGNMVVLTVGFSHPIEYQPREGITLDVEGETIVSVTGADKQVVGQTAAEIRAFRPPEPYKGKGVRYQGEVIRRKAGKAAKSAA